MSQSHTRENDKPPIPKSAHAWMGDAQPCDGVKTVKLCAWCADFQETLSACIANGLNVTTSICVPCYQRRIAAELGEPLE
jgi:hypothetical protein